MRNKYSIYIDLNILRSKLPSTSLSECAIQLKHVQLHRYCIFFRIRHYLKTQQFLQLLVVEYIQQNIYKSVWLY